MTHQPDAQEWEEVFDKTFGQVELDTGAHPKYVEKMKNFIRYQIEKARKEEGDRIELVFKNKVPPHGLSLEDGVWLKRLLNEAFNHKNK